MFPLPAPVVHQYAYSGSHQFGWELAAKSREVMFTVWRSTWSGSLVVLAQWPLSGSGWHGAWQYIASEHPELAQAVVARRKDDARQRADAQVSLEHRAALESEMLVGVITKCVFLGGYGFQQGLTPGESVDLYFTQEGVWITKAGDYRPYLRRSYAAALALEFEGGTVRNGGRYAGGGFGAVGAVEGIAIATLLNSLTAKTTVHTTIRFEAHDAEMFLFTDHAVPRTLEMRFAEPRGRIRSARHQPPPHELANDSVTDRLLRLGGMLDKGQLTDQEFAIAKATLLSK